MVITDSNTFRIDQRYRVIKSGDNHDWDGISLFNSFRFIHSRALEGSACSYYLLDSDQSVAKMSFYCAQGCAFSFYRSTFGSIELKAGYSVEDEAVMSFLEMTLTDLKNEGIGRIEIAHYPTFFKTSDQVGNILIRAGFKESYRDIDHYILIDVRSFYDRVKKFGKHKKLNKGRTSGLRVEQRGAGDLKEAYQIIKDSRESRGISMTMTYQEVLEMFSKFPDHYRLFTALDGDVIVGALVGVIVDPEVFYTFYYGSLSSYNPISPAVMLIEYSYNFAVSNKMSIIDLGRSSNQEDLIEGVQAFKESLDAQVAFKSYFELTL